MSLRTSLGGSGAALFLALHLAGPIGCGREALPFETTGGGGAGGATGGTGGLTTGGTGGQTCVPQPEICDGLDNNCDGQVDETCTGCADGAIQSCYSGPAFTQDVGLCKSGTQTCKGGSWGDCAGQVLPAPEGCDQLDNDCDGQIDNGNPGGGAACTIPLQGVCEDGIEKCVGGEFVCTQAVFPSPELCNGLDDNCNGQIDEGNPEGGADCDTGSPGVCAAGTVTCGMGVITCAPKNMASPEACNGLDDDCNGQVDEGLNGGACNTGLPGACAAGTLVCQGGTTVCVGGTATPEVCDGFDNDCDGVIDDNIAGLGQPCNAGGPPPCNMGTTKCLAGQIVCAGPGNGGAETCNGLDDNCNGQIDEGNPGGGAACSTGLPGICGVGTITCQNAALSCVANASAGTAELCATPGDDNCNGVTAQVFFQESFANNSAAWTLDQEWEIAPAKASMGQNYGNPDPANDHTSTADNGVAGVVIGGNAAQAMQHPTRWLTSPTITVDPNASKVYLQFWRWLNSDFSPWMTNRVEVFDAQTNQWSQVWQSGPQPGVQDAQWNKQVYEITSHAKGGAVRVRFGFNIGANGSFFVSQWNVDDVAIVTEPCE